MAETLIIWLPPLNLFTGKGFRGFPQGLIGRISHLLEAILDPLENGGLECGWDKGSRTRPFELLRTLN